MNQSALVIRVTRKSVRPEGKAPVEKKKNTTARMVVRRALPRVIH
jgi:hypothetical protein